MHFSYYTFNIDGNKYVILYNGTFNNSDFNLFYVETAGPTDLSVNKTSTTTNSSIGTGTVAATQPTSIGSGYMGGNTGFRGLSLSTSTTTVNHRRMSTNSTSSSTGMLQLFPTMATTSCIGTPTLPLQPSSMLNQTTQPAQASSKLLNKADVVTVRQLIAGYRESAAFLLRSADELEHLLLLRG